MASVVQTLCMDLGQIVVKINYGDRSQTINILLSHYSLIDSHMLQ